VCTVGRARVALQPALRLLSCVERSHHLWRLMGVERLD
jgi:hypothetical protein